MEKLENIKPELPIIDWMDQNNDGTWDIILIPSNKRKEQKLFVRNTSALNILIDKAIQKLNDLFNKQVALICHLGGKAYTIKFIDGTYADSNLEASYLILHNLAEQIEKTSELF